MVKCRYGFFEQYKFLYIYITKVLINVRSIYVVPGCGGVGLEPPPSDSGDMPWLDRSRVSGELPDAMLTFSSQDRWRKGKM